MWEALLPRHLQPLHSFSTIREMAPFNPTHDYYAILESSSTATYEEIKSSYYRLALIHHPDKNPGCANSTATTQLVSLRTVLGLHKRETVDSHLGR
jgi:hypothetical protein